MMGEGMMGGPGMRGHGMMNGPGGMMAGGMMLRHSPIPRPYLAVVYAAIGAALLQASINYYIRLGQLSSGKVTAATD